MGQYNPDIHHRRSIRLKEYDYSKSGYYFITICCQNHECFFGHIVGAPLVVAQKTKSRESDEHSKEKFQTALTDAGKMIQSEWETIPVRFPNIQLHEFVVMPNHFHAIMEISIENTETKDFNNTKENEQSRRISTIGEIIAAFKSLTTVKYIEGVKTSGWKRFEGKLWQRNYYEHIIRTSVAFANIANYIVNNPAKWAEDRFYK